MVEIGPEKTQIAVMQYSSYTRIEFGFNVYRVSFFNKFVAQL